MSFKSKFLLVSILSILFVNFFGFELDSFEKASQLILEEEVNYVVWKEFKVNKNYVAANGIIYDVSGLRLWMGGNHRNMHKTGEELTYDLLRKAPHNVNLISRAKKVGFLAFTLEDIAHEGRNKKYYAAFEGLIYDFSYSNRWTNGNHMNLHKAGDSGLLSELTYELLKNAPHNVSRLDRVFKIGILVVDEQDLDAFTKDDNYIVEKYFVVDKRMGKKVALILYTDSEEGND